MKLLPFLPTTIASARWTLRTVTSAGRSGSDGAGGGRVLSGGRTAYVADAGEAAYFHRGRLVAPIAQATP